jgi:hypothetical protein
MGMDRGKIWMADDFDHADPELEALLYAPITTGSPETPVPPKTQPGRKKKS